PAKDKMSPPRYQDLLDKQIPKVALPDAAGTLRVIAGNFRGTKGPARTFTPIDLWDVSLRATRSVELPLPAGHTAMLLVQSGAVRLDSGKETKAMEMAFLQRDGDSVKVEAATDARLLVLSGEPIREPVVGYGPFVMNTKAEIGTAIEDYESGKMGRLEP
ncbi:MAG TPA: pirin-like C-terminal cupin domain-containing protein, partial [Planctomycetota bacterium]|nr:pirin-like C-terminal cupin domain-containing protein [Planctomycetota bacterium]